MSKPAAQPQDSPAPDEAAVRALYQRLLDAWNRRSSDDFAALFVEDADVVGFDGSQMSGRAEIAATLGQIFADHITPTYVGQARGVRLPVGDVAVLRAVAGLVPRGQADINPQLNAVQTLVAARGDAQWRIILFQNTPAQFHGRPDLAEQLTADLRQLL